MHFYFVKIIAPRKSAKVLYLIRIYQYWKSSGKKKGGGMLLKGQCLYESWIWAPYAPLSFLLDGQSHRDQDPAHPCRNGPGVLASNKTGGKTRNSSKFLFSYAHVFPPGASSPYMVMWLYVIYMFELLHNEKVKTKWFWSYKLRSEKAGIGK